MRKLILIAILAMIAFIGVNINNEKNVNINSELNGVFYNLGIENSESVPVTLKFIGSKEVNLFNQYKFNGNCTFNGDEYVIDFDSNEPINFITRTNEGYTTIYGIIFIDNNFTQVTICPTANGWSNEDGDMLTFPSLNKQEAIEVSNQLMRDYFKENGMNELKSTN